MSVTSNSPFGGVGCPSLHNEGGRSKLILMPVRQDRVIKVVVSRICMECDMGLQASRISLPVDG
jgi:hypothetical protein